MMIIIFRFVIFHRTPLNAQRVLWMFPKSGGKNEAIKNHWQIIGSYGKISRMEGSFYPLVN